MVVRVATAASAWADIAVRMRERDPLSSTDEWNPATAFTALSWGALVQMLFGVAGHTALDSIAY